MNMILHAASVQRCSTAASPLSSLAGSPPGNENVLATDSSVQDHILDIDAGSHRYHSTGAIEKVDASQAFFVSLSMAIILFVPMLLGVTFIVDAFRFGRFEFETFDDVSDFRAERYLPPTASHVRMQKHANGYRARYVNSQTDFHVYLDYLWDEYGESSAARRDELAGDREPASPDKIAAAFSDLKWTPLTHPVQYHSPVGADGGGAIYYFDSEAGIAYQQTYYWVGLHCPGHE